MVTFAELAGESLLEAELAQLQHAAQPLLLPARARVFEQGEPGDRMLVITDGEVRSSIRLPDGTEQTLSHAGAGDVVGEIALLTGARRAATVRTVGPVRGWTLDRHGFDVLRWDSSPAAIAFVQRLVAVTTARLRACIEVGRSAGDRSAPVLNTPGSIWHIGHMPPTEYLAGFPQREDLEAVVRHVPVRAAGRGEVLIEQGVRPPSLWLVVRGAVEVTVPQNGATRRVRLAGPGRFAGHNGVLDGEPSPVIARTRERSVLFAFPRERIVGCLTDPRAFSAALLVDTARAIREASRPVVSTTARR